MEAGDAADMQVFSPTRHPDSGRVDPAVVDISSGRGRRHILNHELEEESDLPLVVPASEIEQQYNGANACLKPHFASSLFMGRQASYHHLQRSGPCTYRCEMRQVSGWSVSPSLRMCVRSTTSPWCPSLVVAA